MKRLVVSLRVHYKDADFEEGDSEIWQINIIIRISPASSILVEELIPILIQTLGRISIQAGIKVHISILTAGQGTT
jgi:hypothetical protein